MPKLLRIAIKQAHKSPHKSFLHGSILVRGSSLVATGFNHESVHSEISCLSGVWPSERRGTTMINVRITIGGLLANSRPCPACEKALRESGVKKVIYSTSDRRMETLKLN